MTIFILLTPAPNHNRRLPMYSFKPPASPREQKPPTLPTYVGNKPLLGGRGLADNPHLWLLFGVCKYSGGESNSPVAEWLNKGLMSASNPRMRRMSRTSRWV
eukprot:1345982-Pyramimonas_sp.AAC.1